jgi:hypothetical protein
LRSPKAESTFFFEAGGLFTSHVKKDGNAGERQFFALYANTARAGYIRPSKRAGIEPDIARCRGNARLVPSVSAEDFFWATTAGIAAAEGETMRGRETAKKYKERGDAWRVLGRQARLGIEAVAAGTVMYRFAAADFPISCRESDWILKLGPPLG